MPPTTINQPLKRESASTANVLMCKQWWKVCWMYGDQEKYYRQLYGKSKTSLDGNKGVFGPPKGPLVLSNSSPTTQLDLNTKIPNSISTQNTTNFPKPNTNFPTSPNYTSNNDWASQYYQNTNNIPNVVPRHNAFSANTNSASDKGCSLNRSFSFEEVRMSSPNGGQSSPVLSSLDLTRGIVDE